MIKYSLVDWKFNAGAWAAAIRDAVDEFEPAFVAELMNVSIKTVGNWEKMRGGYEDFPYPSMTNFISFCNKFDRDPRDFFILEDK